MVAWRLRGFLERLRPPGAGLVGAAFLAVLVTASVRRGSLEQSLGLALGSGVTRLRYSTAIVHCCVSARSWVSATRAGWFILEVFFTVLFSVEFVVRLAIAEATDEQRTMGFPWFGA